VGVLGIFYKMYLYYVVLYYGHCNWLLRSNELVDPNNFSPIKNVLVTPLEMKIILHLKLLTNITHVFMFAHCMLRSHAHLNGWGPCLFNNLVTITIAFKSHLTLLRPNVGKRNGEECLTWLFFIWKTTCVNTKDRRRTLFIWTNDVTQYESTT